MRASVKIPKDSVKVAAAKFRKQPGFESLLKFYLSLKLQKPESKMAKQFIKDARITKKEFDLYRSKFKI
jgi:hypothetical protein